MEDYFFYIHGRCVLGNGWILYAGILPNNHCSFLMDDRVWANSCHIHLGLLLHRLFKLLFPFSTLRISPPSPSTSLISPVFPADYGSLNLLLIQPPCPFFAHSRCCPVLSPPRPSTVCSMLILYYPISGPFPIFPLHIFHFTCVHTCPLGDTLLCLPSHSFVICFSLLLFTIHLPLKPRHHSLPHWTDQSLSSFLSFTGCWLAFRRRPWQTSWALRSDCYCQLK